MKKLIFPLLMFICFLAVNANAQKTRSPIVYTTGVPSACSIGRVYVNRTTGNLYAFKTGTGCVLAGNTAGLSESEIEALISEAITASFAGTGQDNFLTSGGQVSWVTGLQFRVSAAIYYIKGVRYTSLEQTVTLAAADGSNPRLDVLYLDTTGTLNKQTGTAAADPAEPSLDPTLQLKLVTILVNAGATTPANITSTDVYKENVEWTTSTNQAGQVNFDGATNCRTGSKCVVITSGANNTYAHFNSGGTITMGGGQFVFYVRPAASWANKSLVVQLYSTSTARGTAVAVDDGLFGFSSSSVAYQQIIIPDSAFQLTSSTTVNSIRLTITGGGGAISFNVDDFVRQAGLGTSSSAFSMLTTKNGVPKSDGNNLVNSNITDTGTAVTSAVDVNVPDEAYDGTAWNGSLEVPTKNALRDKIETIGGSTGVTELERNFGSFITPTTAGTRVQYGMAAMSYSVSGSSANADDNDGAFQLMTTAATTGQEVNVSPGTGEVTRKEWNATYIFKVKTSSSVSVIRFWIGLGSADPSGATSPDGDFAMLRYSTDVDGTAFWRFYTEFGSNPGSPEVTTTSLAVATDTLYIFKIVTSSTAINLYSCTNSSCNPTPLATHSGTLPAGTMGPRLVCRTLENVLKGIKISWIQGKHL